MDLSLCTQVTPGHVGMGEFALQTLAGSSGPASTAGVPGTPAPAGPSFANVMKAGQTPGVEQARSVGPVAPQATPGAMDVFGIQRQRSAVQAELEGLRASGAGEADPRLRGLQDSWTRLFNLQLQVQDMSLRAEMTSKLAEHATSSTKTVLQTQT